MNLLRNTMLLLAMSVVMAHALVAHTHIAVINSQEDAAFHQQANGLLDYLEMGFHHAGEKGFMETFQAPDEVNPEISTQTFAFVLCVALHFQFDLHTPPVRFVSASGNAHSLLFASALSRRGPPSLLV